MSSRAIFMHKNVWYEKIRKKERRENEKKEWYYINCISYYNYNIINFSGRNTEYHNGRRRFAW